MVFEAVTTAATVYNTTEHTTNAPLPVHPVRPIPPATSLSAPFDAVLCSRRPPDDYDFACGGYDLPLTSTLGSQVHHWSSGTLAKTEGMWLPQPRQVCFAAGALVHRYLGYTLLGTAA